MKTVIRYDRGELIPAHRTPEGYLFFDGYATRAGVFEYRQADGTIRKELRPPEEVGSPESLASLARKPVTNLHPESFVDSANISEYGVGAVDPEVVWEQDFADGFVRVKGTVHRSDAVEAIGNGRRELSCGYVADLDVEPGEWTDSAGVKHQYDAVQRNIRYNHLALVDRGRAGKLARLRVDSDDAVMEREFNLTGVAMAKVKIDGQEYDVAESAAIQRAVVSLEKHRNDAIENWEELKEEIAELHAKLAESLKAMEQLDAVKAEMDAYKAKLQEVRAEKEQMLTQDAAEAWAVERMKLIDAAKAMNLDGFEDAYSVKGSNDDIKKSIVLSRFDEDDIKSVAHVDAAFSLMMKESRQPVKSTNALADAIVGKGRADKADPLVEAQNQYNAWINGSK